MRLFLTRFTVISAIYLETFNLNEKGHLGYLFLLDTFVNSHRRDMILIMLNSF